MRGPEQIERNYIDELMLLEDPLSQYDYLLELGLRSPEYPELRSDSYRVEGCKSAIWIDVREENHSLEVRMDSDSALIRGVLSILHEMYADRTGDEIRGHPPEFYEYLSDAVIYPEIKRNGLSKCYQKMAHFDGGKSN